MKLNFSILVCLSTLLLSACDPRFKTTAEICSTSENETVIISRLNHGVKASDDEYRPYLQDILNALQITDTITTEEQAALDKIDIIIKQYMPYEVVTSEDGLDEIRATNALDILESIIATTDSATEIVTDEGKERNDSKLTEAFKLAKRQLASGISANNGFCIYKNSNITIENYVTQTSIDTDTGEDIINEETGEKVKTDVLVNILRAELTLTFDPFNGTFSQNIIMTQTNTDPHDNKKGVVTNFVGFYDAPPNDFEAIGYTPPTVRFGSVNNTEQTEKLTLDDDFNDKLGQIEYELFDDYCTLKDSEGEDYLFTGDTVLIEGELNTLVFTGQTLNIQRNDANDHTLSIDDHNISIQTEGEDEATIVTLDTIIVNSSEIIGNTLTDSNGPIVIDNNILTIDLSKTNGLVTFQNDALYIDGEIQLDDEGGALLIRANTAVIEVEDNTLIIDDAFAYGITNQEKIAVNCIASAETEIRPIQKDVCKGGGFDSSPQPNKLPNEVGKRQTRSFDLNSELSNLKRFRIETDYPNNTAEVYVSNFREAIYDSDGETLIEDPTPCEGQAVLDELFNQFPVEEREASDFEGVRLTPVADAGYDFVFELNDDGSIKQDENGAGIIDQTQLPTPVFTFTGTAIPARQ
jgi:hypothetical protein